jgi:hypothetical protein
MMKKAASRTEKDARTEVLIMDKMQEVRLADTGNIIAWLNAQIEKARHGDLPVDAISYYGDAVEFVKNLPVVEAKPVKHGRWETINPIYANVYCSECGAASDKHLAKRYKGCPYCLCVMDATDTNAGSKGGADNGVDA